MPFSNITIVSVDGRFGELFGAQCALFHSLQELPGAKAILLSPERPRYLLEGIKHISINPLGYLEYGLFIIYALHRFILTDFALIVQADGWVLNGSQWHEDYYNYDYIGSPTHFARVTIGQNISYLDDYKWINMIADLSCKVDVVLNGGFSLRSRRLLEAPTRLNLPCILPPVTRINGPPYRMFWESASQCEDVQLCVNMRTELEKYGIKFAPLEVAKYFAFEHLDIKFHHGLDLTKCFGHHSQLRQIKSAMPLIVEYQFAEKELPLIIGEDLVGNLLQHLGYVLKFNYFDAMPSITNKSGFQLVK